MIFPLLQRFREFSAYPMTLVLIGINVLVFLLYFPEQHTETEIDQIFTTENISIAGKTYLSLSQAWERPDWAKNTQLTDHSKILLLGAYALRDDTFLRKVRGLPEKSLHRGDISKLKQALETLKKVDEKNPATLFGLSPHATTPWAWVTYQFSHGDFVHLLSNILFLWLVGALIELSFGGGLLAFLYLAGGFFGGFFFLFIQDHGFSPVIGASGSVSALLAFLASAHGMKRIPFAYFLAPFKDYFGIIYLPALILIPLFLVSDLGNLLATPEGLATGVAHAAHVGGAFFGLLMGFGYQAFQRVLLRLQN